MFLVGNGMSIRENDGGGAVDIGNPGGDNNWDFSWFQGNLQMDLVSIDPFTSPYISEFPGANIATYSVGDFEGDQAELWNYSSLNGSFDHFGTAALLSTQPEDLFTIKNKPAQIEAQLPLTINSSWSHSYTQTLYVNGSPFISSQIDYSVIVDAYGTMTLPGGAVFEALRMRETMTINGLTSVTYQFLSKSGAQVSVFASGSNPPGSGVIAADSYNWNFEFQSVNVSLTVTHPGSNDVVIAGELDSIKYMYWSGNVDLYYSLDEGVTYEVIDTGYSSPLGTYYWNVPDSFLTTKAIIKVVDSSPDSAESGLFKIKPWQRSRLDENDDFELYVPDDDGWSFSNSRINIWPQTWWQQFDYQSGIDPYTNLRYPPIPPFIVAADSLFPDWPLFVDVFSFSKCYYPAIVSVYRPRALRNWRVKSMRWGGSCFGFAVSSLLGFYHKQELVQLIGDFTELF